MRKKKSRTIDTERTILMAAEKVFADKGLSGARVKDIARLGHVTPAMINYYFGGKENLHRTVLENFFQRVEQLSFSIMQQDIDVQRKLYMLIEFGIELLGEKEHISRILIREFVDSGNYTEMIIRRYLRSIFSRANRLVFSDLGEADGYSSETMHHLFSVLGAIIVFFISGPIVKHIWKRDIFTKKMIEERKREVINLIFNGIGHRFKQDTEVQQAAGGKHDHT